MRLDPVQPLSGVRFIMFSEPTFDFLPGVGIIIQKCVCHFLGTFPEDKMNRVTAAPFVGMFFRVFWCPGMGCGGGQIGILDGSRQ